jgi:hypothetical protein
MPHALVIFNGIRFSHDLVEKAITWAKQNSGSIKVLFLASRETEDQYAFPSDLDAAQNATDKGDAEQSDMRVIESEIQLIENMSRTEDVDCATEIMVEPELDDVVEKAKGAAAVYVDVREEGEGSLMEVRKFTMRELVERVPTS